MESSEHLGKDVVSTQAQLFTPASLLDGFEATRKQTLGEHVLDTIYEVDLSLDVGAPLLEDVASLARVVVTVYSFHDQLHRFLQFLAQ